MIGWVIFRNANLNSSLDFLRLLFGFHPKASAFMFFPLRYYLQNDVIFYLAAAVLFAWLPLERFEGHAFWRSAKGIAATGAASLLLIIYSAIVLSTAGFNPFIYFQF
jgi:hypothetical protein